MLGEIASIVTRIAGGDMQTHVDIKSLHKDFYKLGTAVNNMQKELIIAFSQLENSRDNLEIEINEKSKIQKKLIQAFNELEHAKENLEIEVSQRTKDMSVELSTRKKAEKALKESKEKFRELSNLLPATVFEINLQGNFTYFNQYGFIYTGYTLEDMEKGLSAFDLFIPKDKKRMKKYILRVMKGLPNEESEYTLVKKDGTKCSVIIYTSPITQNKKTIGARGIVFDRTELKKAEQELLRSKQRLALHAEQTPLAYIEWSENMEVLEWNPSAEHIFGYSKKEAIGKTADELIVPINTKVEVDEIVDDLKNQAGGNRSTNENITKDGEIITCEWYNTPLVENGKVFGIASLAHDITDRVKGEEKRRKLQDKLEKAERMESLGILAGGVAHDLNNLLGPLVAYPEMILEDLEENHPVRADIEIMGKAAEQSANVIQDLLTLARRGRYEMKTIDINNVIKDYLESPGFIKLEKTNPNVKVDLNIDSSISKISGSSTHLSKVVMNLIVNAFDAIHGDGTLTITTSQNNISDLLGGHEKIEEGDYILMKIKDSGQGIDPDYIDKIFEPYYSNKTMGGSSGSGLGLSVVYGVVKDHCGYYDILSEVGRGTEFIIYFPATDSVEENNSAKKELLVSGQEKILIVDDVEQQRELASRILSSLGYEIVIAENGTEAVEYLKENSVDLVVLDMIMEPGFDGLDTFTAILKIHPHQKAIIISGFSPTERVETMILMGAGIYVKKPFTKKSLSEAVRKELNRKVLAAAK